MYSRHYRYNPLPLFSNPTTTDIQDPLSINFFDSIVKARAFLNQVACLNQKQLSDPQMQAKIAAANRIAAKADRRNTRRKARRAEAGGKVAPTRPMTARSAKAPKNSVVVQSCDEAQLSVERLCDDVVCSSPKVSVDTVLPKWEEVLGPKGEVVRFKLTYGKSKADATQLKDRKRSKEHPANGDIILDLTSGVAAWQIKGKNRVSVPISKRMETFYKSSTLYKVRQFAAGVLSPAEFAKAINNLVKDAPAAKKSLRKKKKK